MSTSSPWSAASIVTSDGGGSAWLPEGGHQFFQDIAAAGDGNVVDRTLAQTSNTQFLQCSGFDFGSILPAGAIPNGVELQLQEWFNTADGGTLRHAEQSPRIKIAGPAVDGTAKPTDITTTSTLGTYGGAGDDWSMTSLTRAIVAASAFGIRLRYVEQNTGTVEAVVDMVRMRIHYQDEITVSFPISGSSFDQESVDTSIADWRATRVVNNLVNSDVTRVQWEFRENGGTRFSHFTNSGGDEVGSANILGSGLNFLDLWLPPSAPYTVRTREFTNSWGAWNGVNSFTALGLVNSFEKYQILNRGSRTVIPGPDAVFDTDDDVDL